MVEYVDSFSYDLYRDAAKSDSEDNDSEDEDSNDENNWRNDYPDEDDYNESVGEDDMREAMEDFDIGKNLLILLKLISSPSSVLYPHESNPFTNRRFFWTCKDWITPLCHEIIIILKINWQIILDFDLL